MENKQSIAPSNRRILITGVSGLLGNNLAWYFREGNQLTSLYFTHPVAIPGVETFAINLLNYPETRALVFKLCVDVVIHCASRTDVEQLESEVDKAQLELINLSKLPQNIQLFRSSYCEI